MEASGSAIMVSPALDAAVVGHDDRSTRRPREDEPHPTALRPPTEPPEQLEAERYEILRRLRARHHEAPLETLTRLVDEEFDKLLQAPVQSFRTILVERAVLRRVTTSTQKGHDMPLGPT